MGLLARGMAMLGRTQSENESETVTYTRPLSFGPQSLSAVIGGPGFGQAEDVDIQLNMSDVRVDVYRSGGHGGQGVNTTDSAVRLTYKAGTPDEMVVTCQDGRSQLKNKEKAFTVLRSRLFEIERERIHRERSQNRASQVGSGDRSEKIRTYNYPQNRVTDHRLEGDEKNNPLESVMLGNLEPITEGLKALERLELLASKVSA